MPKIFGIEHIIYMIITFAVMIAGLILIGKFCKSDKSKLLTVKISGIVLLITILINRYACTVYWPGCNYLPASLCGTLSLIFGIFLIVARKDSKLLHSIVYAALLAGLFSTIYPTYIGQGSTIFCFPTITSLLHHSMDIFCAILLFVTGWVKPNIKKWASWLFLYFGLICYGLFMIKYMGESNAMSINAPLLAGTNLDWLHLGLYFTIVYTVFLIVYDVIKNKKNCIFVEWYNGIKSCFTKKKDN